MTVCNMAIEGGARAGLIAPDEKTNDYVRGRPHAPKGGQWEMAVDYWKTLTSDEGAHYDKVLRMNAADIAPVVTWGTSPEDVLPISAVVPAPEDFEGGKVEADAEEGDGGCGLGHGPEPLVGRGVAEHSGLPAPAERAALLVNFDELGARGADDGAFGLTHGEPGRGVARSFPARVPLRPIGSPPRDGPCGLPYRHWHSSHAHGDSVQSEAHRSTDP